MKKCGYVFLPSGKVRPFTEFRTIERGKNKGRLEIKVGFSNQKTIVEQSSVRRFPT